jgi:hypothetical protein
MGIPRLFLGKKGKITGEMLYVTHLTRRLPLDVLSILISELLPKLRNIQRSHPKSEVVAASLNFLSQAALSDVIPTHTFTPRPFVASNISFES